MPMLAFSTARILFGCLDVGNTDLYACKWQLNQSTCTYWTLYVSSVDAWAYAWLCDVLVFALYGVFIEKNCYSFIINILNFVFLRLNWMSQDFKTISILESNTCTSIYVLTQGKENSNTIKMDTNSIICVHHSLTHHACYYYQLKS